MPDADEIDRAIAAVKSHHAAFADALRAMYNRRYTGATTVHWSGGVPRVLELPGTKIYLSTSPDDDRT